MRPGHEVMLQRLDNIVPDSLPAPIVRQLAACNMIYTEWTSGSKIPCDQIDLRIAYERPWDILSSNKLSPHITSNYDLLVAMKKAVWVSQEAESRGETIPLVATK